MCDQLNYTFLSISHELDDIASNFKQHSTSGVMDGCVGCLNGIPVQIKTPSADETGNVKAYFSGHYWAYEVNVQVVCDSQCCFIYAVVAAPGGTNNIAAFHKTSLHVIVERLLLGK